MRGNSLYNEAQFKKAKNAAVRGHGFQAYDEIFSYEFHLDAVDEVLVRFSFGWKYRIAGQLHDIIEDAALSYNKIKKHFGEEIAEIVYCVTDELGRNRKEKKAKTLPKTAGNSDAIIVKLADRIANIEHGGKIDMYRKEYEEFKSLLHPKSNPIAQPMWDYLEDLLEINKATA